VDDGHDQDGPQQRAVPQQAAPSAAHPASAQGAQSPDALEERCASYGWRHTAAEELQTMIMCVDRRWEAG